VSLIRGRERTSIDRSRWWSDDCRNTGIDRGVNVATLFEIFFGHTFLTAARDGRRCNFRFAVALSVAYWGEGQFSQLFDRR
jgi:hypothetical protein